MSQVKYSVRIDGPGAAVKRAWLLGVSATIVIAVILVASPLGTVFVQRIATDINPGIEALGYALTDIFPSARLVGVPAASTQLDIGLSLPLQNAAALSTFIQETSTPGSPDYRHFLTPSQFLSTYAPTQTSYDQLIQYFAPYGVTIQPTTNRLMLSVIGSPSAVGAAFHTQFMNYEMPNGQVFYGPTSAPVLPFSLGVSGAFGFTNALYNHPADLVHKSLPANTSTPAASCPNGDGSTTGFNPTQIADAYGENTLFSASENGAGMTVGIVDAYDMTETQTNLQSDLTTFSSDCGLPTPSVHYAYPIKSSTYNSSNANNGWGGEEVLDMDWVHATARGAQIEMTFSPNAGNGLYDAVDYLVANNVVNTISLSWGEPDVGIYGGASCTAACNASTDGSYAVLHPVIEAAVAEGISVFVASGDCGAADGTNTASTDYPASDEDSTGVGGTVLTMSGTTYTSETAWTGNESGSSCTNNGGAGGGWAPVPQPWYQSGTGVKNNGLRGVPDVGITAGSWLDVVQGGSLTISAGTSDAAPQWAGLTAIADQIHKGDVGLINPSLYAMLRSSGYSTTYFHDITTGNNGYPAGTGWDPVTGVGTPRAQNAIPYIASGGFFVTPSSLNVSDAASTSSGSPGLSVTFTAKAAGGSGKYSLYDFYFGDGNAFPTSSASATHVYPTAGAYAADVVVFDSTGNSSESNWVLISVGSTPFSLSLSASSNTPSVGTSVTFTATATGGTAPYLFHYGYGDGVYANTSATTVSHSFAQAGVYCAQVTGTDSKSPMDGAVSNIVTLDVGGATGGCPSSGSGGNPPTISSFTATPNPVTVGTATTFSVSASGGTGSLSYAYSGLPPGCPASTSSSFSCTPSSAGAYSVTVTVTDSASKSSSKSLSLVVNPSSGGGPVISSFTASPNPVVAGSPTTLTVSASGGTGSLTYSYTGLPSPCSSSNTSSLSCTPATAGNYTVKATVTDAASLSTSKNLTLTVTSSGGGKPVVQSFTATVNPVQINSATTLTVSATGGTGGYSYVYTGLPGGCTTANTSSLGCTPTVTGTFTVVVTVTDSAHNSGTGSLSLQVTSSSGSPLSISSVSAVPNPATQGSAVTITTTTSGGRSPLSFAYSGLPAGCSGSTGNPLTCVPSVSGTFTVTVTVTDSSSPTQTATKQLTLTVNPASSGGPTVTLVAQPSTIQLGNSTIFVSTVTGGSSPYTYVYSQLPPGCTTSDVASLSCTPTSTGTYTVVSTVTDAHGLTSAASAALQVTSATTVRPVVTAFSASGPITVGQSTTFTVVVQGGTPPYSYQYTGLPAGCTSANNPSLPCTPTSSGNFNVTVTVTDSKHEVASASYTLVVNPAVTSSGFLGQSFTVWLLIAAIIGVVAVAAVVLLMSRRRKNDGMGVPSPYTGSNAPPPPLQPWDEGGLPPPPGHPGPFSGPSAPPADPSPPVGPSL